MSSNNHFLKKIIFLFLLFSPGIGFYLEFNPNTSWAIPLFGPSPSNEANPAAPEGGNYNPPQPPSGAVPSLDSPGLNGELPGNPQDSGNLSPPNGTQSGPNPGQVPGSSTGGSLPSGTGNSNPNATLAPTFMNGVLPNSTNPFLPSNISPGLISQPLENNYIQNGVPLLAAPLMSVVYRPFGLTYFQPNPFQVTPQGTVSLTGTFETDTNINFSPTQPEVGSLYSISPAIMYSNFDDYGYISLLASASYYAYDTGNIPPYLDEVAGVSLGTYLGTRIFVGAQDFFFNGFTPMMNGLPMPFLNGVNSSYGNMADAELGVALTPKITFVESASDMYYWNSGYGAGIMNLQTLMESLNYMDKNDFVGFSYSYQQGFMTDFPNFSSNNINVTAMRTLTPSTSMGFGGGYSEFIYQNLPAFDSVMYDGFGILTHKLRRNLFFSAMGGWNAIQLANGQIFQSPMGDINLSYSGAHASLGLNAGYFMQPDLTYGVELGPTQSAVGLGYLNYVIGPKTTFTTSLGYTYYEFYAPAPFAHNFLQSLQPNLSYNGTYIDQSDIVTYTPYRWMSTSLMYNLIDFTSNIPNVTIIDNQFIAMVSFFWNFK